MSSLYQEIFGNANEYDYYSDAYSDYEDCGYIDDGADALRSIDIEVEEGEEFEFI